MEYRPLTKREREILDYLLTPEISGVEELRRQVDVAVARPWVEGSASIDLAVDQNRAPRSSVVVSPALEAQSKDRDDPNRLFDLLLWVDDGWLSGIELVEYGDKEPEVFPPPSDFDAPRPTAY